MSNCLQTKINPIVNKTPLNKVIETQNSAALDIYLVFVANVKTYRISFQKINNESIQHLQKYFGI